VAVIFFERLNPPVSVLAYVVVLVDVFVVFAPNSELYATVLVLVGDNDRLTVVVENPIVVFPTVASPICI
jgi:hypothetical protein